MTTDEFATELALLIDRAGATITTADLQSELRDTARLLRTTADIIEAAIPAVSGYPGRAVASGAS